MAPLACLRRDAPLAWCIGYGACAPRLSNPVCEDQKMTDATASIYYDDLETPIGTLRLVADDIGLRIRRMCLGLMMLMH